MRQAARASRPLRSACVRQLQLLVQIASRSGASRLPRVPGWRTERPRAGPDRRACAPREAFAGREAPRAVGEASSRDSGGSKRARSRASSPSFALRVPEQRDHLVVRLSGLRSARRSRAPLRTRDAWRRRATALDARPRRRSRAPRRRRPPRGLASARRATAGRDASPAASRWYVPRRAPALASAASS